MKFLMLLVPAVLLATVFLSPAACEVYYVQGSSPNATPCPPEASTCLTLQEYVDNSSEFLPENVSDVEFRFLSGEHSLSNLFEVKGGRNITLKSANVTSVWEKLDVTVKCKNDSYFQFIGTASLSIRGMAFHECGNKSDNIPLHFDMLTIGNAKGALTLDTVADLNVQDVEFIDSVQVDILANDLHGMSNVSDMIGRAVPTDFFISHIFVVVLAPSFHIQLKSMLLFTAYPPCIWVQESVAAYWNEYYYNDSSVTLRNVTITGNASYNQSDILFQGSVPIFVEGCNFSSLSYSALVFSTSESISVVNTSISGYVIGLTLSLSQKKTAGVQNVFMENCSFTRGVGSGVNSGALTINAGPIDSDILHVTLKNLFFEDNNSSTTFNTISSIMSLGNLPNVTIEGVNFTNNRGIPLLLFNTTIHLSGENYFIGNSARDGGGMAFFDNSFLVIHDDSLLVFKDNHADNVGGAWYVSSEPDRLYTFGAFLIHYPTCFINLHPLPQFRDELKQLNISVQFINNSAHNGGNALYGGDIDVCGFEGGISPVFLFGSDLLAEESIFTYEPKNDPSRLSSDPTRVCLCENQIPNCLKIIATQGIYPGQSFNISVVAVGQRFSVVNGTVYGQLLPRSDQLPSQLERLQKSQLVGQSGCTNLSYSIQSKSHIETIALTARDLTVTEIVIVDPYIGYYNSSGRITQQLISAPVYVNVSLLNCPAGFILSEEPSHCICDPTITRNRLTCDIDIDNGTVERSGEVWVSSAFFLNSNQSTSQDGVAVSLHCPNGYCNESTQHINLLSPDVQCNFNRSGILCGGCPPGLSLALGSNQCLKCSNSYIALLVPFAVCGVLLVLLIHVVDLTVAVGTINGLIFYANIVKSYEPLFFVPGQTNILTVFISWLNLDLGIETCFFSGLDGYTKTWLQFAFPLYIWVLAGLIVFLARYRKFALIFGGNAVPVLATMFLLSYNKLFRTIITAFSFITLELPDNSSLTTWKFDANLSFLETKHTILFITSLLVFVLAWLPYTLVLFFYQFLLRFNHKRGFRWVFRLKPFFDANFGPLKDKHLYWVGVLLLARALLLLIFVASSNSSDGALISVAVVSIFLILYNSLTGGHVYKNWFLSLLESSFFVNLNVLCVATYYAKLTKSNQAPVIYTSISIAFLEFIGIVCYHCYRRALSLYQKFRGNKHDYVEMDQDQGPRGPQKKAVKVTHSEIDVHNTEGRMALRESILDD